MLSCFVSFRLFTVVTGAVSRNSPTLVGGCVDDFQHIIQPNGFTKQLLSVNRLRTNPICCLYHPQVYSLNSATFSVSYPLPRSEEFPSSYSSKRFPSNNAVLSSIFHQQPSIVGVVGSIRISLLFVFALASLTAPHIERFSIAIPIFSTH